MSNLIRDPIFVKQLERRLGRKLEEEELEELSVEAGDVRFPNGRIEYIKIPLMVFPDALLSAPECYNSDFNTDNEN